MITSAIAVIFFAGQLVVAPKLISIPNPKTFYPAKSLAREEEGLTKLRCTLGTDGLLSGCSISQSSGFESLDAAALKLAAEAQYSPRRVNNQAVASEVILPVRWALEELPQPSSAPAPLQGSAVPPKTESWCTRYERRMNPLACVFRDNEARQRGDPRPAEPKPVKCTDAERRQDPYICAFNDNPF